MGIFTPVSSRENATEDTMNSNQMVVAHRAYQGARMQNSHVPSTVLITYHLSANSPQPFFFQFYGDSIAQL